MTSPQPCMPSQQSSPQRHPSWSRSDLEAHAAAVLAARHFLRRMHYVEGDRDTGQVAYAAMTHLLPVLDDLDRLVQLVGGAAGRSVPPATSS